TYNLQRQAVTSLTSNATGTVEGYSVWKIDSTDYSSQDLKVREYEYNLVSIPKTLSGLPITEDVLMSEDGFIVATESAAAAMTGISVAYATTTVTVTVNHNIQDLYDYIKYSVTLAANLDKAQPLTTSDGTAFLFASGWNLVVDGAEVQQVLKQISYTGGGLTVQNGGFFEDKTGAVWESGGNVYYASHIKHTIKDPTESPPEIQGAEVAYFDSAGVNRTYTLARATTTSWTSNASGTVEGYSVWKINASSSAAQNLTVRQYGYNLVSIPKTLTGAPITEDVLLSKNAFIVTPESEISAITYISINYTAKTVTVSASTTIQKIYDYIQYDVAKAENLNKENPLSTSDGTTFLFATDWDLIVTGAGVEVVQTSKRINYQGTGALTVSAGAFYEDGNGAVWETGGSVYYASHIKHTIKIGVTLIEGAEVAYFVTASTTNQTYDLNRNAVTSLTSNATGTVEGYSVWKIDTTDYSAQDLKVREYEYNLVSIPKTLSGAPITEDVLMSSDTFIVADEATAAAMTGITVSYATTTVTVTANHNIQDLYDYIKYSVTLAANLDKAQPLTTSDGTTFTFVTTWNLIVSGAEVQQTTKQINYTSGSLTVQSSGFFEDKSQVVWESSGNVYYASHIKHTIKDPTESPPEISGAEVAYFDSAGINRTYTLARATTTSWTSNASGTVEGYSVWKIGATSTAAQNLTVRQYAYNLVSIPKTLSGAPITEDVLLSKNAFIQTSENDISQITYININYAAKTVTVTASTTIQILYDYIQYDVTKAENLNKENPLSTSDGTTFLFALDWDLIVTGSGVEVVQTSKKINYQGAGNLTVSSGAFYEDGNGAVWESGGNVYYASHIKHTIKIGVTLIEGAELAYFDASNINRTYNLARTAVTSLTSNASGTVEGYSVWKIDTTEYAAQNLIVREYEYNLVSIPKTLSGLPITEDVLMSSDTFIVADEATAAAMTGIAVAYATTTVTVTANHNIQDLYDYIKYNVTLAANLDKAQPLTTSDGTNFLFASGWNLIVNNATVQQETKQISYTGGGALTVQSGGFFEDRTQIVWESSGNTYYASHIRHTIKDPTEAPPEIQGAEVAYFDAGGINRTYTLARATTTSWTSNASGTVEGYAVWKINASSSASQNLTVRQYGYNLISIPKTLSGAPITEDVLLAKNSFVIGSEGTISAITYIAVNYSAKTVTVTASTTIQTIYDYIQYNVTKAENLDKENPLSTSDGTTFLFALDWDLIVTGSGVQVVQTSKKINYQGTGNLTVQSGAFYEDGNGAVWESGGSVYYASHIKHTIKIGVTLIEGAELAYFETASGTNKTYDLNLNPVQSLTSNASGTVEGYAVWKIDTTEYASQNLKAREYSYQLISIPKTLSGAPITEDVLMAQDLFIQASKDQASQYTGINVDYATERITVATTTNSQTIYDYVKYSATLAENMDKTHPFYTSDGFTYISRMNIQLGNASSSGSIAETDNRTINFETGYGWSAGSQNGTTVNILSATWNFNWPASSGTFYQSYTFDITVKDSWGVPLEEVTVKLSDKFGTAVFEELTNASGTIPTQTVTYRHFTQSGGNTPTEYGPHNLSLTKTQYIPYSGQVVVDKKTVLAFSLKQSCDPDTDYADALYYPMSYASSTDTITVWGDASSTPPMGYDANNPITFERIFRFGRAVRGDCAVEKPAAGTYAILSRLEIGKDASTTQTTDVDFDAGTFASTTRIGIGEAASVVLATSSSTGTDWAQVTASANWSARRNHTSVDFNTKMWVIGGDDGTNKSDVWYSTDGITWAQATSSAEWSARRDHTSVVFDSKMWVIG
ncbi:hypothetical protein COT70_01920, partial [candidate division WWE3 bacterium CG09_land_8_20_14_0_10_47_33]